MTKVHYEPSLPAYAYPECPYACKSGVGEFEDPDSDFLCKHENAVWFKCISHSYMDEEDTCPFDIKEELRGDNI